MPEHIRGEVQKLVPRTTSCHAKATHHSPDSLQSAKFVFICRDAHHPPLQHPYDGPYRVLDAGIKIFVLDKNGKKEHVSIDQLKQAHVDSDQPLQLNQAHVDSDQPLQLNLPRPRGRPKKATEFSLTCKAHNYASIVPSRELSKFVTNYIHSSGERGGGEGHVAVGSQTAIFFIESIALL